MDSDIMKNSKTVKKIALIGAGQIGSRHLQGLARIDIPVILQVVDPGIESLKIAKERYLEVPKNVYIQSIYFLTAIDGLDNDLDLCIIATNSDVRFRVFQELVSKKNIPSIVFEKVSFQSNQQFEDARELVIKNKISCWVNCPRRMFPIYKELKKLFEGRGAIKFQVRGGDFGLACNGIHFIDLLSFFANDSKCRFDISGLDQDILPSKRKGFIEITGNLKGTYAGGSQIELEAIKGSDKPIEIIMENQHLKVVINENQGLAKIFEKENNFKEKIFNFKVILQSELTHLAARQILDEGACGLTDFNESFDLQQSFLSAVIKHVENVKQQKYVCCAIT